MSSSGPHLHSLRPVRALAAALVLALLPACTGAYRLVQKDTAELPGALHAAIEETSLAPIAWFAPALDRERAVLARWRSAVGPPLVTAPPGLTTRGNRVTIVSWNAAVGAGNLESLMSHLRATAGDTPVVVLLQEAYRSGATVPGDLPRGAIWPRRLAPPSTEGDLESAAARLGMQAYYVPSMRDGGPPSDGDRGNAIVSDLPLSDLSAIELPFERQRRVAVRATISGLTSEGEPWQLDVASLHLDNVVGPRRLWIAGGEFARVRQLRGVLDVLGDDRPAILAGDLNTWFGFSERAVAEALRAFPQTVTTDWRPTFLGLLRLDHMFSRLPEGWTFEFQRLNDRFGSDHYPLVGTLQLGPA